jgi:uncharacterized protein (DUF1684 family)
MIITMRIFSKLLWLLVLCISVVNADAQSEWLEKITEHRAKYFNSYPYQDRKPYEAADTLHLDFFAPDSAFKVTARFEPIEDAKVFEMPTYSGSSKPFQAFGYLHFKIGNDSLRLTIYQNIQLLKNPLYKNELFLPFKDISNGSATYGGGRYLELTKFDIDPDNEVILDFNFSYNPWCAYGDGFNCPVPPSENHLSVEIPVGEKAFKKTGH